MNAVGVIGILSAILIGLLTALNKFKIKHCRSSCCCCEEDIEFEE